jgi:hypothetical protein
MKTQLLILMGEGDKREFDSLTHPHELKRRVALSRRGRGRNGPNRLHG